MSSSRVTPPTTTPQRHLAAQFILLMGLVSLFGDITYEGGRSLAGPYLGLLGASATVVGLVAGLGELVGYALRLVSGLVADRTRAYWPLTFLGYGLLAAVPLLAFAGAWPWAALFLVLERLGKAVRSPARDTIMSQVTKDVGRGWGFAVLEAVDQIGAVFGPVALAAVLAWGGGYPLAFSILWVPVVLTLLTLAVARRRVPDPTVFERDEAQAGTAPPALSRPFVLYGVFIFLSVAGFASFALIAYHLSRTEVVTPAQVPLLYALAMGVDAVVALIIGAVYDRVGLKSLAVIPLLSAPIAFLGFTTSPALVVAAVVLWGAVMGVHETVMRAAVADLIPVAHRASAYGVFNTVYGVAWLAGSAAMGWLYDTRLALLPAFVVALQVAALVVMGLVLRRDA